VGQLNLRTRQLSRRFGTRIGVDALTFDAERGEVLGLLGPNGAGKTTTIRLLSTVLAPTSGEFSVAGIPSSQPAEIRRRVGVLPESAGYPRHQTGLEYLTYYARLFGHNHADAIRTATGLLDEFGLTERAASPISIYSRGMRQRLGIARALVNDPDVVFLDEPTLGLDPAGQLQILHAVREVAARRGATVVLSTHMLAEVEAVCSKVLILDRGRMLKWSTVAEVTAAVGAPRSAVIRVPLEQVGAARQAVGALPGRTVAAAEERPDVLRVTSSASSDGMNAVLQELVRAGVPILGFEVEGTRLTDAYLSLTRDSGAHTGADAETEVVR